VAPIESGNMRFGFVLQVDCTGNRDLCLACTDNEVQLWLVTLYALLLLLLRSGGGFHKDQRCNLAVLWCLQERSRWMTTIQLQVDAARVAAGLPPAGISEQAAMSPAANGEAMVRLDNDGKAQLQPRLDAATDDGVSSPLEVTVAAEVSPSIGAANIPTLKEELSVDANIDAILKASLEHVPPQRVVDDGFVSRVVNGESVTLTSLWGALECV